MTQTDQAASLITVLLGNKTGDKHGVAPPGLSTGEGVRCTFPLLSCTLLLLLSDEGLRSPPLCRLPMRPAPLRGLPLPGVLVPA